MFICLASTLSAQLPNWYFFRPSNNGSNIRFTPSPSLQSTSIPIFKDDLGVPLPNYYSVNAMYDNNGQALFFIVQTKIGSDVMAYFYDRLGNNWSDKYFGNPHLLNINQQPYLVSAREMPIIPIGCGRYHVVIGNEIVQINYSENNWERLFYTNNPLEVLNVYGMSGNNSFFTAALEIGSVSQTSYKVYSLNGNVLGTSTRLIRVVEISKTNNQILNSVDYNFFNFTLPGTSTIYSTNFTRFISELELSNDGQLLAFAEEENILIFNLNSNGYVNTSNPINTLYFYQNTPTVLEYAIGGLEFSTNNDKLIFSRYDPSTTPTLPEEIAVWEFTTNPIPNFIPSTLSYVRSQIETGLDGKIYTSSATHLAEINLTGTPTVTDIVAINIELNNDLFDCQIRTLPDQISGYTYQATPYDIETYEVNSNANWTPGNANNPFNATSAISVLQKITIKSGVSLSIEDLTLDFFTNAEIIVEPGATLNLKHATLKSHDCGLMWKGISLQDNGTNGGNLILSNNNQLQSSTLRDAITGITVVGPNTDLIVHGYTLFTANETDIKITNGNKSKIQIHRATFDGGTILRDQTKGSNHGWILDNLFRTTTNIDLIDCNSKIEIGSLGQGGCDFKYAEYGIRAIKSNAISYNNTFLNHMRYGIHGNAQKLSKREIDIYNNIFTEVQQPIRLENWIGSTIQGNQFYTSREFGIDYLENENCILLVGDLQDPSKGNLFDFCNWTGINLSSNAGLDTKLIVANNSINNHPYATGIVVSEFASIGISPSFKKLQIHKNSMSQIGHGIKLYNIEGHNANYGGIGPTPHNQIFDENTLIDENEIIFTTQLAPNNQVGIQTNNSNKLNIHNNTVNSQNGGDWRNTAILTDDAYWSSIFGNTATGGAGIRIGGNMLTSNVYCNSLNGSSTGILLNYCYLRPAGGLHGILVDQSRDNSFPAILDVDIRVYNSNKDLNQWVFSGSIPNIDYTYATGTLPNIEGGYGANSCGESLTEVYREGQMRNETSPISTKISGSSGQKILNPNLAGTNLTKTNYGEINALKSKISNAKDSLLNTKATHDFARQMAWADFYIQRKKYDSAAYVIKNTIPRDSLEIELNWTYTTLLKLKNSALVLSKLEEERLIEIAQKSQFTQSIAAPLARTLVKQFLHLDIYDKDNFIPSLKGRLMSNCNYPNLSNLKVSLMNQSNQLTGISTFTQLDGSFEITGDKLKNMDLQNNYRLCCTLPDSSIIYSSQLNLAAMIKSRQVELNCQTQLLKKQEKKEKALSLEIITIFPNPSNGIIKLMGLEAEQKIYVVNMLGEVVYSGTVTPLDDIDLSYLSKGIYLIKLMNTSEKAFKLVIE
jgi:hypothetical protein